MNPERSHQTEVMTTTDKSRGKFAFLPQVSMEKIANWQLLIAILALLGLGFSLGQRFQLQQPTTVKSTSSKQTNILPVKTTEYRTS